MVWALLRYSQHLDIVCCTYEKPHSNFWIETGALTNREGLKKPHSNFSWCPLPWSEQWEYKLKNKTILSTSWNQSLVAYETRQPLICISNETVCYSCWGEKKWSLYRTWFLSENFAFHSMTPAQPVYRTCSSQALVQKLLGRCSKQHNNTGEKLTSNLWSQGSVQLQESRWKNSEQNWSFSLLLSFLH